MKPGTKQELSTQPFLVSHYFAETIIAQIGEALKVNATLSVPAPQLSRRPRMFVGKGRTSGNLGAAAFNMWTKWVISPTSGLPGTLVTVQNYGFGPMVGVAVGWNSGHTTTPGVNKVVGQGPLTGESAGAFFTVTN